MPRDAIESAVKAGRRVLVFTDFDGTLVPIHSDPFACRADAETQAVLAVLRDHPRSRAAVVSGRDLSDLVPRIGVLGIPHAGNHGLEIAGPGIEFREPTADRLSQDLTRIAEELATAIADVPGAWVQNKILTASVHYRQTSDELVPRVYAAVDQILEPHRDRFVVKPGKKLREIRPKVDWNKGHAIDWLIPHLAAGEPHPFVVFLGDDATDEDGFRVVAKHGGIGIRVGPVQPTAATHRVDGPADVLPLLRHLAGLLR